MKSDSSPNPELEREIVKKFLKNVSVGRLLQEMWQDEFLYGGHPFICPKVLKKAIMTEEQQEAFKKDAVPLTYTEEGAEVQIWAKKMADEMPKILFESIKLDGKIHKWKEGAKISRRLPPEHVPATEKPTP